MTENGMCVHGFLIELLKILMRNMLDSGDNAKLLWGKVSLWYSSSTITKAIAPPFTVLLRYQFEQWPF
jgi:hypothetical protein